MPPRRDALDRVDELGDVAHAVLQQVADARRVVADELQHVRRLEVLRQHEHRHAGAGAADLGRGRRRPSSACGRHAHVDDRDVRVYERTFSISSSASPARPTIAVPASSSSDAIPSRRSASSSATTTLSVPRRAGCALSAGVASARWRWRSPADRAGRSPTARSPPRRACRRAGSSRKPIGLSRSTGPRSRRSAARSAGSSARSGSSVRTIDAAASALGRGNGARRRGAARSSRRSARRSSLAPGEGPARTRARSGEPMWIVDAPEDANFPRAEVARRYGLHAALGFPLQSARACSASWSSSPATRARPTTGCSATMASSARASGSSSLAGRPRPRCARASRGSRPCSSPRSMRWCSMDHRRSRARLEPRRRGDLRLRRRARRRPRHGRPDRPPAPCATRTARASRGSSRPGAGAILDRRLESDRHAPDGTESPVELTITRIARPGPPTFTGYLRDITDRNGATPRNCAPRARGWSRRPTPSAADPAQPARRRSAAAHPVLLSLGRLRASLGAPSGCSASRSTSSPEGLEEIRELASGLPPRRALRAWARAGAAGARHANPARSSSRRSRPAAPRAGRGRRVLRRRRGARQRQKHAGRHGRGAARWRDDATVWRSASSTTAPAAPTCTAAGCVDYADHVESARRARSRVDSPAGGGTRLLAQIPLGPT